MNPWQIRGNILPCLCYVLERVHGSDVWSYRPLLQKSGNFAEHIT
jgi:hypothetical protein